MKIKTLDCGCQRQLEDVIVNNKVHEIQVFGHTPDDLPLSQEDKEKIARIIENFLANKENKEEEDV